MSVRTMRIRAAGAAESGWPRWPLLTILWVLFLGPPAAALFIASGAPLITETGWLARDLLSTYICPTPARSYDLLGAPMAVCARCWGATIGLWGAYLLVGRAGSPARRAPRASAWGHYRTLHWVARLLIAALPFGLWVGEIAGWQTAPLGALLLNGALAGCAAGLFFCSIWPGLTAAPKDRAHG